jgi:hypothetical protein
MLNSPEHHHCERFRLARPRFAERALRSNLRANHREIASSHALSALCAGRAWRLARGLFAFRAREAGAARRPLHIAVLHGNAPEDAALLANRIRQEYQPAELLINITGPVLGLHTGPRALALCAYAEV